MASSAQVTLASSAQVTLASSAQVTLASSAQVTHGRCPTLAAPRLPRIRTQTKLPLLPLSVRMSWNYRSGNDVWFGGAGQNLLQRAFKIKTFVVNY